MERIYFDNGSTSFPKAPGVSDAVKSLLDNGAFNINRGGYEEAYAINPEESYHVMAGRACACMGNPVAAERYYQKVKDPEILKAFEIQLSKKKFI